MKNIPILQLDHLGIRVTDINTALDFYALLGFEIDSSENLQQYQTCALLHRSGLRLNLIYNAENQQGHNVLLDEEIKYPGITHLAIVVDDMEEIEKQLSTFGIAITEGPMQVNDRRIICFIRDPDGNVIEFNQILK